MKKDLERKIEQAKDQKESIDKTFNKMKKKRPKHLDKLFHTEHNKAFDEINCLDCANCCKTTSPIFRDIDIKRISKKMKRSESDFIQSFLKKDEDGDWVLQSAPCPFLGVDNKCDIYEFRPQACAEYPHTDRKRMIQILDLTKKNVEICPAVAQIAVNVGKEFF